MPDIVVFTQHRGTERVWVTETEVDHWLAFWHKGGCPAARYRDYQKWGGFFPPHPETVGDDMFYPATRRRRFTASR
jgi:hypothetical protein